MVPGWNTALSRPVCSMILKNLSTWNPPKYIIRSIENAEVEFDMVQGLQHADAILDHVKTTSRQGILEIYKLALADQAGCAVIRAKRSDGAILGTVVLYNNRSRWAEAVPALKGMKEKTGGISSAVISPSAGEYSTLMQGLILLGIRQIKMQQSGAVILDCVSLVSRRMNRVSMLKRLKVDGDGNFDSLSAMGFSVLQSFEEVSCDAWTMVVPPL